MGSLPISAWAEDPPPPVQHSASPPLWRRACRSLGATKKGTRRSPTNRVPFRNLAEFSQSGPPVPSPMLGARAPHTSTWSRSLAVQHHSSLMPPNRQFALRPGPGPLPCPGMILSVACAHGMAMRGGGAWAREANLLRGRGWGREGGQATTPENTALVPIPGRGPTSFLSLSPCLLVWLIPAVALDCRSKVTGANADGWGGGRGGRGPGSAACYTAVCTPSLET